jgi:hypothetical protein
VVDLRKGVDGLLDAPDDLEADGAQAASSQAPAA